MNKKSIIITSLITILPCFAGIALWNVLPENIPVHWNFAGEIDGYAGKAFAVFFMPLFILAMHLICVLATKADPKAKNVNSKIFLIVLWICPVVSILCMGACFAAALEYDIKVEFIIPLFMGILFLAIGNYIPKCKRNYVIGIKVPWTIDDEENWNATHRFAGKVWTVCSLVVIVGAFFSNAVLFTTFVPISIMVVVPIVFSYIYYKNHKDKK